MNNILNNLDHWVNECPDKTLYSFMDINGDVSEEYTYAEFDARVKIIANNLSSNYDFKKNDRIMLAYPPGVEMICAFFACVQRGLVPVPTYPPSSSGFQSAYYKMAYLAKDCNAVGVLTNSQYYWSLKLNLDRNNIIKKTILSEIPWINSDEFLAMTTAETERIHSDILFIQYTSGSTTDPKGVMVSHDNLLTNCKNMLDHVPVGVTWLPQYHDMGLIGYYLFFAITGGTTHGFATLDFIRNPSLWLESISKFGATASSAPNFAFEYCIQPGKISEEVLSTLDLSSLKILMSAAEPVRPSTYQKFLDFFKPYGLNPDSYCAAYGLAENTLAVSNFGQKHVSLDTDLLKNNQIEFSDTSNELTTQIMSCGKPLTEQNIKIVDDKSLLDLGEGAIGEVWLNGPSKCLGYWNKPKLNKEVFEAKIANSNSDETFLRTGDMGFLHEGELYICSRLKDMIIIRGLNYYPHDIEKIVEDSNKHIRKGGVAAFAIEDNGEEKLVVLAGVKNKKDMPDPLLISEEIRKKLNILTHSITFVTTKSIPKTSSGKIRRQKAKQLWLDGELEVLKDYSSQTEITASNKDRKESSSPFDEIKTKYGFTGNETYSLVHALDSLDLVLLIHDTKALLKDKGATKLANDIDARLLQELSVSEFFDLIEQLRTSSIIAITRLKKTIKKLHKEHKDFEQKRMLQDAKLPFEPAKPVYDAEHLKSGKVLLTGGTGFLGPFILRSLLEQTDDLVYVLVRAANEEEGMKRLVKGMELSTIADGAYMSEFRDRVIPVCGDLGKPHLGLNPATWDFLSKNIHTIYNNGALVNYLFNYEKMRAPNVLGTNEIIKLALNEKPKILNHVSTTFIFGWAVKDTLFESDSCDDLDLLDFGYSQTKWVSEKIILDAMTYGLKARIFRPALISPAMNGGGNNFDIAVRLVAFMINHGITVNSFNQVSFTPVDVVGNNIVAISGVEDSVNQTFHITRDKFARMKDITDIITQLTGQSFTMFELPEFVPEIVSQCKKEDLLFPLLDFLVRSVGNISAMEFKLYSNDNYQKAKEESKSALPDPSLVNTVKGMLRLMINKEIVNTRLLEETEAN
jgi:thioester reductase-like protein